MATIISNRRWSLQACVLLCLSMCVSLAARGQTSIDSILGKVNPQQWATAIGKKASSLEEKIISKSLKTLNRLQQQEEKLYRRMLKSKDSLAAKAALADIQGKYAGMREKLKNPAVANAGGQYIPKLDSLTATLKFLDQNGVAGKVKDALQKTTDLQDKFKQTEEIKKFIKARKQQLKEQLEKLGMVKQLRKFNKEVYYYSAQIKEYKEILKDSKKVEKKALELLSKTKPFKDFFRRNSQLASLFRIPGDPSDPSSQASLAGLQTRAQVNNLIQQQIAAGGPGAQQQVSQNIQTAQAQLNQLKDKVLKAGNNSSGDELPDFKVNSQRTKSFWQKWELGINIQSNKANGVMPVSSDLGISAGFKPNDKFIVGVGMAGRIGWGRDIRHIAISYSGVSARSFAEIKLKGSFNAVAGFEMNYRPEIRNIEQLRDYSSWLQSGLAGISKTISVKSKFFKKTRIALMWDFLSYEQVPRSQPVVLRIGYQF